jgi:hypothetical protein
VQPSKSVDPAVIDPTLKSFALDRGKTGDVLVFLRACDVDFRERGVPIAADDQSLTFRTLLFRSV